MEGPRKSESLRLLSVRIEIGNLKDYVIFAPCWIFRLVKFEGLMKEKP